MIREYNPDFSDPPIDHAAYSDPRVIDRTEPREILSPYPELWSYWQAEMDSPNAYGKYCSGGIRRMHDPRYLRDVIRHHLFLKDGGDPPMIPALAERMATLLAPAPDYAEMRETFLNSPWKRALQPHYIHLYRQPAYVEKDLWYWNESKNPFSQTSLRRQRALGIIFGGAAVEIRDLDSGKVVARRDEAPPKADPAGSWTN